MKTKRYIPCSGLAFCDREDMEMLHVYAKRGWVFREFKGSHYVLHKEEAQDIIFSYDLQKIKKADLDEYLMIFESAGWKQVDRKSDFHFFYAPRGTTAVHTDSDITNQQFHSTFIVALVLLVLGVILVAIGYYCDFEGSVNLAGLGGGLLGAGGILSIGCYARLKGKRLRMDYTRPRANVIQLFLGVAILCVCFRVMMKDGSLQLDYVTCLIGLIGIFLIITSALGCKRSREYQRWKKEVQRQEENL